MYVPIFGESSGRCNFWRELKSLDRKTSIDRHIKTTGSLLDLLARFGTDMNVAAIEAGHLDKANMNGNIVPIGRDEGLSRLIVTLSVRSLNRTSNSEGQAPPNTVATFMFIHNIKDWQHAKHVRIPVLDFASGLAAPSNFWACHAPALIFRLGK